MNCQEYRNQFRTNKTVSFTEPYPGIVRLQIVNPLATAEISLYAGHVMSYAPVGQTDLLWMSQHSYWEVGKPIRGGIPVCWPWFGAGENGRPAHGLARISPWSLASVTELPTGETVIVMTLADTPATRALWDHAFRLELTVSVGKTLQLTLSTTNPETAAFEIAEALHTYFTIGDIARVAISGFDGCSYLDSLTGKTERQHGDITFSSETDRAYYDPPAVTTIIDPVLKRQIANCRGNSTMSVVWNPWIAKSQRMSDFGDSEYLGMLCMETANVRDRKISVPAGATHRMTAEIKLV